MAADLVCKLCVCILFVSTFTKAATSNRTTLSPSSNSGCTCDLTGNGCDINCCCDQDCTAADKEAFTKCIDADLNQDDKVCLSQYLLFTQNTNYKTTTTGTGLFCLVRDNYASRNFYNDIPSASTAQEFSTLRSQTTQTVYDGSDVNFQQLKPSSTTYKAGDPILLFFESGAKGFLALPKPMVTKQCDDGNPVAFLQDGSSSCTRSTAGLSSQCSSLPFLAAASYYSGFKIAKNPSLFSATAVNVTTNSTNNTTRWTLNNNLLVTVTIAQPLVCQTELGIPGICGFTVPPNPTYDAVKKTCNDVVLEVSYTVNWNTSTDITSASVEFVLGSISADSNMPLLQKYSVKFLKEDGDPFYRSGNPGYIVGKPLVGGTLQVDAATKKEAIVLSVNPKSWLTIAGPTDAGACSGTTHRIPVTFGMDMRTGCTIRVTLSTTKTACQIIQDTALNALLGSVPTHVATFGNSDVNKVGDWVKILNSRPTQTPDGGDGVCKNMIMSLHIEVLYANFGYLANPQPKVVGVLFKYGDPQEIRYQCIGASCQHGNLALSQSFEVTSSVGFVDVSKLPEAQIKPRPTFEAKAPSDFFYPFL